VARDARSAEALRQSGYRVIVIWECETKLGEVELRERLRLAFDALGSPPA
jgi:G:T-mismatch repair DNA endonuclease (very short patch repair protein)